MRWGRCDGCEGWRLGAWEMGDVALKVGCGDSEKWYEVVGELGG